MKGRVAGSVIMHSAPIGVTVARAHWRLHSQHMLDRVPGKIELACWAS